MIKTTENETMSMFDFLGKDYPGHEVQFLGVYDAEREDGRKGEWIIRVIWRAKAPNGPFRFVTMHGSQFPHYVHDPDGWAPMPKLPSEDIPPIPIEKSASMFKLTPEMQKRFDDQKREFDKLDDVIHALKAMPAIVDDDYPMMRHRYDGALRQFLLACKLNGRFTEIGE